MSTEPLVYTREELADALKVGLTSLSKIVKDQTFPAAVRFAGPHDRPKWPRAAVQAWLDAKVVAKVGGEQ